MSLTLKILTTMLSGFLVNVILTPVIIRLAHRNKWYDEMNHRKIHTEDIPRLGGFGIFVGMLASAIVALSVSVSQPGLPGLLERTSGSFGQLLLYFSRSWLA